MMGNISQGFALLTLLPLSIFLILIYGIFYGYFLPKIHEQQFRERIDQVQSLSDFADDRDAETLLQILGHGSEGIVLVSEDGLVLAGSFVSGTYDPSAFINMNRYEGSDVRYRDTGKALYVSVPVTLNGVPVQVKAVFPTETLAGQETLFPVVGLSLIAIASSVFIGWFVSHSITHPLSELRFFARQIESGMYEKNVSLRSFDEINELVHSFDKMRMAVREATENLNETVEMRTAELMESNMLLMEHEAQLREANQRLIKADGLKDEFINIAAHELRTPIVPIILSAENLLDSYPDNPQVERIVRNAHRLNKLAADILNVTRIDGGKLRLSKQTADIISLVSEIIKDFQSRMTGSVSVEFRNTTGKNDLLVSIDKGKISEVIANLLDNALKFTEKGKIVVSIDVNSSHYLEIRVRDSGKGVDPEIHRKLFQKFVSKDSMKGTGLGLYISKAIIEAHGGTIFGENNAGEPGASFGFAFSLGAIQIQTQTSASLSPNPLSA